MYSDPKSLERALRHRKTELLKLIEQMKSDHLHKSPVLRNLEHEVNTINTQLSASVSKDRR